MVKRRGQAVVEAAGVSTCGDLPGDHLAKATGPKTLEEISIELERFVCGEGAGRSKWVRAVQLVLSQAGTGQADRIPPGLLGRVAMMATETKRLTKASDALPQLVRDMASELADASQDLVDALR